MTVSLPADIASAMDIHASNEAPLEACGLVAGVGSSVFFFYPLVNVAAAADRYEIDPLGHVRALRHAERSGWELIGSFHSHPAGRAVPSERDIEQVFEAHWLHFLAGSDGLRAWRLDRSPPREVRLDIVERTRPSTTLRRHAP